MTDFLQKSPQVPGSTHFSSHDFASQINVCDQARQVTHVHLPHS